MLCVFMNTIVLCLDGLLEESHENLINLFNTIFTFIFTADLVFKMLGLGLKNYLMDRYNQFDLFIVILSLVELIFLGG